jgi:hypothetical protein
MTVNASVFESRPEDRLSLGRLRSVFLSVDTNAGTAPETRPQLFPSKPCRIHHSPATLPSHAPQAVRVTGTGGRATAQAGRWPRLEPRSSHVGFVVDKVALGHVFSEYFGFPCQSSFHRLLHNHHHHHLVLVQ